MRTDEGTEDKLEEASMERGEDELVEMLKMWNGSGKLKETVERLGWKKNICDAGTTWGSDEGSDENSVDCD